MLFLIFFQICWGLVAGFVSWVLGFVSWVLGFVRWVLGFVFWVLGLVFSVLGLAFWVIRLVAGGCEAHKFQTLAAAGLQLQLV